MDARITLVPETEAEAEVMEQLAELREEALEEMTPEDLAYVFSQFAAGLHQEASIMEDSDTIPCPECGTPIKDVEARGLGKRLNVEPCKCVVSHEELPSELYLEDG